MTFSPDAAGPASAARALESADVVVVGAGPAGSAAAAHLRAAGLDVIVLERADAGAVRTGTAALTPQAVGELRALGIDDAGTQRWHRTTGVRFVGGGMRLAVAWPDVAGRPGHGLTCAQAVLDDTLSSYAVASGARVHRATEVTGFQTDARGRVNGVAAQPVDGSGQPTGAGFTVGARVVIDASGVAATGQPSGLAVSVDFASPRHLDDHVETWLSLTSADGTRLPGHGWIVGRGDGHVTAGVGALAADTSATPDQCAGVLQQWLTALPAGWQLTETTTTGPVRAARLGTARAHRDGARDGVLHVGDAAGAAHPVTGEGLTAALVSARVAAATVVEALTRTGESEIATTLAAYGARLDDALGRHERWDRLAARLLDRPSVARLVTTYALPREALMKRVLRHATPSPGAPVETSLTPPTMVSVTRAAAHPGTERGVDQR
ncbi:NAD(P)/FAD-dependent oxidoreductase [Knoellia aerolata]|uniref:FAD-binding domain-containing protein n=1 Tax=Knoellia aerolata DSM 18566 TaxID=1385519 RepID=A0A0A0K0B2_9MICO|nr:NAD(P)/FAD-dependent oxidoreductase [Knoellia aerolata]KGN43125.1 hypothetical protein N801_04900 [Knoellia aerolata DSM 18566]